MQEAGLPGALAIGTVFLLFLYLRSERSAAPEPSWLPDLRADLRQIKREINEGLRDCNGRSDKVDDRLRELGASIAEIKVTVQIIARRHE